ncbi:MAG: hypothetical protein H6680_03035 [Desulfobacteraceae bacterium]|nr:hypothetical protein [Desulfobacteraceae bacterium]
MKLARTTVLLCFFLVFSALNSFAETPQDLYQWKEFLLYGEEKYHCVPEFDNDDNYHCIWPGILNLEINEKKIVFSQKVTLFSDSALILPGNLLHFPVNVKINNIKIPVSTLKEQPVCFPGKGNFKISGEINFDEIPDYINLPDHAGGYRVISKTEKIKFPYSDSKNILWLKKTMSEKDRPKEHIRVNVYRKIRDSIPCEIESVYKINVSGSTRQEIIKTGQIPGQIAFVKSMLPLKIEKNGSFLVQVKPGEYEIYIKNIIPDMPLELGPFNSGYDQEIIVHEKEPGARLSNIENLKSIDPKNTDIPSNWKNLPAYILLPDEKIIFKETLKGVFLQQPELNLEREIWLDFNGKGSTLKDQVSGRVNQRTFIGISDNSEIIPGKISINGKDQIITSKNNLSGIPVNEDNILIEAVSRKDNSSTFFPVAWNLSFSDISGYINIPPAFDLFMVTGAKIKGNHTFLSKWTLLDIFVLCILFISAFKIWNIKWGIIFFICAGAVYHKFYLPPYIWIFLVICSGILNSKQLKKFFFQKSFFRFSFNFIYFSCLLTVFCAAIIFSAQNIKYFVYPSLDTYNQPYRPYAPAGFKQKTITSSDNFLSESDSSLKQRLHTRVKQLDMEIQKPVYQTMKNDYGYTQTGAGIPSWSGKKIRFENALESGIKIYVLKPFAVRIIYLSNVFFLFALLLKLVPFKKIFSGLKPLSASKALLYIIVFSFSVCLPQKTFSQNYPPEHLLKEYKERLLKEKDFDHKLAVIENCILNASAEDKKISLEMIFKISSLRDCAINLPLTGDLEYQQILLDSKEHDYILKSTKKALTLVPKGIHELKIKAISKTQEIDLKFDMLPLKLSFNSKDVMSKGIEDKKFASSIKLFIPSEKNEDKSIKGIEGGLPFPVVERHLFLGREWKIHTVVSRYYSENINKKAEILIPLIKNEKILRETFEIKNNNLEITLMPGTAFWEFESEIPVGQKIEIPSNEGAYQVQKWTIDSDSLNDFQIKGLIPVKYNNHDKTVFVQQPKTSGFIIPKELSPVKGRFFTIDYADICYDISKTRNTLTLNTSIRAGKGLNHKITYDSLRLYPEKISINNIKNQISETNGELSIPLSPGKNEINIVFNEKNKKQGFILPKKISFPLVNFNAESSNISQEIKYQPKSWIIAAFGPRSGPAVLFWGYFAAIIIAAGFLAKFTKSFLKPHQFILLAAGLSLAQPVEILIVFGFFFAIEYRKNLVPEQTSYFNLIQTGIILLLIMSASIIYDSVSSGLLGIPDMQITGNGSYSGTLKWFTDKCDNILPKPFIIMAPINMWKLIIFLWSIWISAFLINKTPYIIDSLKHDGFWKKTRVLGKKNKGNNTH